MASVNSLASTEVPSQPSGPTAIANASYNDSSRDASGQAHAESETQRMVLEEFWPDEFDVGCSGGTEQPKWTPHVLSMHALVRRA